MSDNGEKLIIPEEQPKSKQDIILVDLDEDGRIRIEIKTSNEPLLINALYYINKVVDSYIVQQQVKKEQAGIQQAKASQELLNRIRGQ